MLKRLVKLFNMSTTTATPESFSLFPYLPDELRTLIWKHAVDPYRVLRIVLYQKDFPPNPQLPPSSQFLGSAVYGPPWNVKVGCTDALVVATRHVRDLMRVSREAYKDIMHYILPDRIHVTVDWDPPYLRGTHKYASQGEMVYKVPWNRRTERVCLEMVHLSRDGVRGVMREEMPRGSDLPAPPVWVNQAGYEPFGQDAEPDSESDPDESRDPSRPSRFYVPPADVIASVPDPDPDANLDRDPDPRAPGEIYIPHSLAQSITRRHISLAPTFTHLTPVAYGSSNPLLMLCKILRVTNITIIADSILHDPATRPAGPSPAWVDEHKVLHEPGMAELGRLGAALGDLLEEEAQQQGHDGALAGTASSTAQTQTQTQIQTPHTVLARELLTMSLSPRDLAKTRFFRLRDPTPPPQDGGRRNAREAQRIGGEWGNGRPGTWVRAWGDQNRAPSRRDGQYGGFGSTRGWWSGPGSGGGPWGMGSGVGYAAVWRGGIIGAGAGAGAVGFEFGVGGGAGDD